MINSDRLAEEIVDLALDYCGRTPAGAFAAEILLAGMDFEAMAGCSECGAPEAHLPEECPKADWFISFGGGACEAWYVRHDPEGREIAATIPWGTEEYHAAVAQGVEMMHAVSACGVDAAAELE